MITPASASPMLLGGDFAFNYVIAANAFDFNLRTAAVAAGWDQVRPLKATVTINAWVVLGASSTSVYAFDTGVTFPLGSSLSLNVGAGAYVSGAGGNGGNGTGGTGQNGFPGGNALRAQAAITIINNGTIQGGGGGGGGGGAGWGGGDGGAGAVPGQGGGSGGNAPPEGAAGIAGTLTTGFNSSSYGGGGGNPGGAGTSAATINPGGGGAPGSAVIGNANITWSVTGTRLGALS